MKKRWGVILFITGISSGWLIRGSGQPQAVRETAVTSTKTTTRAREVAPKKAAHDTKWLAFGKRAKELSYQEKAKAVEDMAPGDRMAAVEALAAQAGLEGLDYNLKSMMQQIIEKWTDEDFDGAWKAAQDTTNPDLRKFVMRAVLNQLTKSDPEKAFAFHLEELKLDPSFSSSAPNKMLQKNLKIGAAEYLAIMRQLPMGSSSGGTAEEYAADFDFRQAADGVAELMKGEGTRNPSSFPNNFFTEWAKKNPDEVFKWWAENPSLPFNDFGRIIKGIELSEPGSSTDWIVSKLQDSPDSRDKIIKELSTSSDDGIDERLGNIAKSMETTARADDFLAEIAVLSSRRYPRSRYDFALSTMSSPQARLEAFQKMKDTNQHIDFSDTNDAKLQSWGVTRAQVEQIFARPGKN